MDLIFIICIIAVAIGSFAIGFKAGQKYLYKKLTEKEI